MRCLNQLLPALCSDWSTESTLWDSRVLQNKFPNKIWRLLLNAWYNDLLSRGTWIVLSKTKNLLLMCFCRQMPKQSILYYVNAKHCGMFVVLTACSRGVRFGGSNIPNIQPELNGFPSSKGKVGFGGLVVNMLASGTQVRGFKPGQSSRIFRAKKFSACLLSEGK
jgi:hypothetical protein